MGRRVRSEGGSSPYSRRGWLRVRQTVMALTALGLVVLAAALIRPARTDPILGPDGEVLTGSVAELITVRIGGHDQVLMIRGHRHDGPVLLWLAGGPGGSDIGAMRLAGQRLEEAFVVVTWEQRGTGKSVMALEPTATMTLDQAVADTLEVTEYLRNWFDQDRIYLAGNSWGTIPSVLAAQRHPERFHAFIGAGQMVDPFETDQRFYEDTLAYARQRGDRGLETTLLEDGPPPYDRFLDYAPAVFAPGGELLWNDYPRIPGSTAVSEMPGTLLVPEYSLLQDVDLRRTASHLDVPVYLVQGRHEAPGRAELAEEWLGQLEAPHKELITFEGSGHRPMFEEPDRFFEIMTESVLAGTRRS